jgi:hypothetical protein
MYTHVKQGTSMNSPAGVACCVGCLKLSCGSTWHMTVHGTLCQLGYQSQGCVPPPHTQHPQGCVLSCVLCVPASAAAIVMRAVRNTVDTGRTVVCTIHQPALHVFDVSAALEPCHSQASM